MLEAGRIKSKNRHVEASHPGRLVGIDLFYIGALRGGVKFYQFTAVDCYHSFAFTGIHAAKPTENAVDFIDERVLPFFGQRPVSRVLTGNGKEFTPHREGADHRFSDVLEARGISHTTRVRPTDTSRGFSRRR